MPKPASSENLVEKSNQAIDASRAVIARMHAHIEGLNELRMAGNACRLIQESQACLQRLQVVLDAHAGVVGYTDRPSAAVDIAFQRFREKLLIPQR